MMNISLWLIDDWMNCGSKDDEYELTLDKDYLTSLRDLKALHNQDKEHQSVACTRIQALQNAGKESRKLNSQKACLEFENGFKSLSRGMIAVVSQQRSQGLLRSFGRKSGGAAAIHASHQGRH